MDDVGAWGGEWAAGGQPPRRRRRTALFVAAGVGAVAVTGFVTWRAYVRVDPLSYGTFWVPSPAMEPTYAVGDIVRVRDIDGGEAERGDVVIIEVAGAVDGVDVLIKRVVAVGGDEIAPGPDGTVLVDGEAADEPYLAPGEVTEGLRAQEVPAGHVFVMGDNRENSSDSRIFGAIPEADVLSVVLD